MENPNPQNIPNIQEIVKPSYLTTFKDVLLSVGVANFAVKTILSPLERWKIISQTQMAYPLRPKKFKGFLDFIKRVPSEQGVQSLWRGNMTYCWMQFYQLFFQIFLYDSLKEDLEAFRESNQNQLETTLLENILFPFVASFATLTILHPLDSYRVRTSMSYHQRPSEAYFTKFRQYFSYVRRQQSFFGIYRGFFLANVISFFNFHIYFNIAKSLTNNKNQLSPDILASFLGIILLHPLDSLKKIMQLNNMSKPVIVSGYRQTLKYIKQNSSYGNLYNGFSVSLVKMAMSVGIFWVYQNHLSQKKSVQNKENSI